ncbi:thiamine pyrophosphate-binding protein [Pseudokordiimonas caeni]|uniref:thiamine pyrophosphate-binding protein n=1 Tax=Pseudokordiimonas caeni TaxID=2997908 RepID=UPI0028116D61|nr:thiamine pyrophosphate-binding protein [Pseudokordiimonas caeni]
MSATNVAEKLVQTLKEMGVRHVFGVPSGGWVDYMEAMRKMDGIDFVLATHEGGASFMADVTARLTGVPGVCFGTFGPGATNLTTGVGGALLDRSPMIAFTDEMQPAMRGRVTQMGIDHQALFAPVTKKTTRLEADRVTEILHDAALVALDGRPGPVHVGLPVGMSAEPSGDGKPVSWAPSRPAKADKEALARMTALFKSSSKPVVAIGLGAVQAGVQAEVIALIEKFNVPVVLTPMAKGMVPETHPSYAGVLFHALSDVVGKTHQQADLVVAIGYDPVEFNLEGWMPDVPLVNIDVVPVDLDTGKYTLGADVTGDIVASIDFLMEEGGTAKAWDLMEVAERKAEIFRRMSPQSDVFGPTAALDVLRDELPEDGIMTCDVGAHTHLIGQKWPTPKPGLQIMTNGWSAMGFGIPAAIAAKLARPNTEVCAVLGDGGFLMTVGELAVAVREKLKIVFVVLTDNDLALIRIKQQKKQNPIYGTPIRAKGNIGGDNLFGVPVKTAASAEEFRAHLKDAFAGDGPVIVEALVSSHEYDSLVLHKDKP